ncbi:MAG TPA: CPBP family intramembrane glutamic endopeptidase [Thermoanaerobaculia bacterium]|nr:CPBP family intramembrane glutamic endopeptidase [Thermoanaerobaculia bacterium]
MTPLDLLRAVGPALLALAAAYSVDRLCAAKGVLPPGFAMPWRRGAAMALLAGVLWIGVFAPLGMLGLETELDVAGLTIPRLFLLHAILAGTLLVWFLLGYAGSGGGLGRLFAAQFGFRAPQPARELGLGLVLGLASWAAALGAMMAAALVVLTLGGEDALPKAPPALFPWIAALPAGVRLLVSLSAGAVEETFFRGFLQPRAGLLLSTLFFVLAHASYAQPLMLVGVTVLSLLYGGLVRWRQSVWAAIAAHALFDAVQLLVVVPAALELLGRQAR